MYHKPEAERETGDLILQSSPDATTPESSLKSEWRTGNYCMGMADGDTCC